MDEIGQKLRSARIKKGYTIDDLQQITKLQKRYLIAIEEGQFDHLPGDFYVRAFIKQYAEAVDLSSDELLEEYKSIIPDSQPKQPEKTETKTRSVKDDTPSLFSRMRDYIPQIIVVVVIILIVGVVVFGMTHRSNDSSQVTIPKDSSSQTKSATKKKTTPKKSTETKSTEFSVKAASEDDTFNIENIPSDGVPLEVTATGGQAWIQVEEDSETIWQQALSSGQSKSTTVPKDVKQFTVHTGNANITTIKLNNKDVDLGTASSSSTSSALVKTYTFKVK
ncbi:helix-turn-helix domain-containing protein [Lactobacillus terrae]|uniref:helix-turn-helix domain-containing protein n=1 Tax=Lactobacillus terrae TaxID=2269374 RepID=UPI000C1B7948|nr:helix-turn-helix domain-containing protein [Lactobacillus terrae]